MNEVHVEPNEGVDVSNKEFNKEETSGEDMDEIHEEPINEDVDVENIEFREEHN